MDLIGPIGPAFGHGGAVGRRRHLVHPRSRCCASSVERIGLDATLTQRRLSRPSPVIILYDANGSSTESCCSRCPLLEAIQNHLSL